MGRFGTALGPMALDRWPLVGRSDEFAFARERIAGGGSVVIAGDAGVGKTRLARELIKSAEVEGRRTECSVATHAGRSVPFGALAHLVSLGADGACRDASLRAAARNLRGRGDRQLVPGTHDAPLRDAA